MKLNLRTVGELKAALASVPDEMPVAFEQTECYPELGVGLAMESVRWVRKGGRGRPVRGTAKLKYKDEPLQREEIVVGELTALVLGGGFK